MSGVTVTGDTKDSGRRWARGRGNGGGRRWTQRAAAMLAGVLGAAVALGVAEPIAALIGPTASPVIAVGQAVIVATPEWAKEFAIRTFGENDKIALLVGVFTLLTVFAAAIGLVTLRRVLYGVAGVALFGLIGVAAAVTRPQASPFASLPSLVGALAGVGALLLLARPLVGHARLDAGASAHPPAAPAAAAGAPAPGPSDEAAASTEPADASASAEAPDAPASADGSAAPSRGLNRRGFVRVSLLAAAVAAVTGGVGRFLVSLRSVDAARAALDLPAPAEPAPPLPRGVDLDLKDLTEFYTPNDDFYRVDTALVAPEIDPETWQLRIHGRVAKPLTLTFDDLLKRDMIERDITLACVSNEVGGKLNGNARWLGVPLKELLDEVAPEDGADQILSTSADGWTCSTPTKACRDGRDAMLAVAMNGEPLPVIHGFPVRMLVPGLYGYVSATKWVVDMELTSFDDVDAYWTKRKWKREAPIKVFSRIDTPRSFGRPKAGTVAVAGIAYAQHRGIERVEVRVDGGRWQKAKLAAEASIDTWRQWSWTWDATPGQHTLESRATDKDGVTQTGKRQAPFPDGATGWHSVVVIVT